MSVTKDTLISNFMFDTLFGTAGKVYSNILDINKAVETTNLAVAQPDGK